jgi:hypothetical protein
VGGGRRRLGGGGSGVGGVNRSRVFSARFIACGESGEEETIALLFAGETYKDSIAVTNACDETGAIYFSSGGDYSGCPE